MKNNSNREDELLERELQDQKLARKENNRTEPVEDFEGYFRSIYLTSIIVIHI